MSRFLTLAALAAALFAATPAAEARTNLPEGSYLDSCRNLYVEGDTLYGECRDSRNKWKKTWISGYAYCEGDIINNNGVLDCAGGVRSEPSSPGPSRGRGDDDLPGGNWSETCRDAVLDGYILRASCKDRRNTWRPTWIDLRQCKSGYVDNEDGLLVCAAAPRPAAPVIEPMKDTLPRGPWVDSCRNAAVKQSQLRGECFDGEAWVISDLDMRKCKRNSVVNNGGRLRCE